MEKIKKQIGFSDAFVELEDGISGKMNSIISKLCTQLNDSLGTVLDSIITDFQLIQQDIQRDVFDFMQAYERKWIAKNISAKISFPKVEEKQNIKAAPLDHYEPPDNVITSTKFLKEDLDDDDNKHLFCMHPVFINFTFQGIRIENITIYHEHGKCCIFVGLVYFFNLS